MRRLVIALLTILFAVPVFAAGAPKTDEQKVFYAIGVYQTRQLSAFKLTPAEFAVVQQGFADSAPGKHPKVDAEKYSKQVQELAQKRRAAQGAKPEDAGKDFRDKTPRTEEQKALYSIGVYQARQLAMFDFTPAEFEMVRQGFADSAPGKHPKVDAEKYSKQVQELAQKRRAAKVSKPSAAGMEFLNKAAAEKGAVRSDSGLIFISQREGSGDAPAVTDTVKMHYRGTLIDGKEFDNTIYERKPAEFKLNSVIRCWTEGLQKMKAGGKAKLICPPELAYGKQGVDSVIPPDSVLIFEIELLEVRK